MNKQFKIATIVGARPQFIKNAPMEMALDKHPDCELLSIHTGQHYDHNMSQVFYEQLGMRPPDFPLDCGGGSHGLQTARMLEQIEQIFLEQKPDMVIVYGDTNSTLAAALAASKLHIPIAHVEAGLRSFNKEMPEEINRVLTDHISDLLFVPSDEAISHLKKEGITKGVHRTGDIMADMIRIARESEVIRPLPGVPEKYAYATIHRPYNTDQPERLKEIFQIFNELEFPVFFSIHPRTRKLAQEYGLHMEEFKRVHFVDPQGYFNNLSLLSNAEYLLTDSGGMQKEAYMMKIPCITIRKETEWTETLKGSWNQLVYENLSSLPDKMNANKSSYSDQLYGDGHAAEEMVEILVNWLVTKNLSYERPTCFLDD